MIGCRGSQVSLLLSGVDQAGVVNPIAIQTAKYSKNVTVDYHDDNSREDPEVPNTPVLYLTENERCKITEY